MSEVKMPWADNTGGIPLYLDYFDGSMIDALERAKTSWPDYIALDFLNNNTTYAQLWAEVDECARALKTLGVRPGDAVSVILPNCPQAVIAFYAINMIGGIASMIHPLAAEKEIENLLNTSHSVMAITFDQIYPKFERIRDNTGVVNIVLTSIKDMLNYHTKAAYMLVTGRKVPKVPANAQVIFWKDFLKLSGACYSNYRVTRTGSDPAAILYSGGTTGTTKGIVLTNYNLNALAAHIKATHPNFLPGDRMLAALPLFHGFGLGVCIHAMLYSGGCCVLVPRFTAKSTLKLMDKKQINFAAGVPTLFEAIIELPNTDKVDLSSLKGVFSGGDSLSIDLKKRFDAFLHDHWAAISVREGYGATETVSACCLTPAHMAKEGSIGIPFPDTYIKIVKPDTDEELPYGETGEILISGPAVMKEYIGNPEETARTLRHHEDGRTWLYTGDLGFMDEDGFLFFKGRSKRMIISSGYNIYPGQIENVLDSHEKVHASCVIGIPDPYKMHKAKAFVVLNEGVPADQTTKAELIAWCRKNVARYAVPAEIEFRSELPKTLIGKIDYRKLEREDAEQRAAGD